MKIKKISLYVDTVKNAALHETLRVYDMTVEDTHTYVVAGVVVSNSKRISLLDTNALLSAGAPEVLRDASVVRGQKNEDYWLQYMSGFTPKPPRVPYTYEKFINSLKASGINVLRQGSKLQIMAMTNADVDNLAEDRVISSGETVRFDKNMEPIKGGLFDPQLTGGHNSGLWSKIKLEEPLLNPVMEEPVRRLLGLTQKQLEGVVAGEEIVGSFGTGSKAIKKALEHLNIDKELDIARQQIRSGKKTYKDAAIRRLGYLKSAKDNGVNPADWVLDSVPVLPPMFRPVSIMGNSGMPLVSDPNYLYKELIESNKNLKEMRSELGDEGVAHERRSLYQNFKALTGLTDPIHPKLQEKNVKGILKSIFGSSPKLGVVQRKLISSTVDNVGRAVVTPNPDLDMDSLGIPKEKAYEIFGKDVVRELRRRGLPITEALKHLKERSKLATDTLVNVMDKGVVIMNRAPVLHKFGIMAFKPQLVRSNTVEVPPLVVKGFGMDFDGDAVQFHVPGSEEARKEALERLLPSKNLISPADFKRPMHVPTQEYAEGLYIASSGQSDRPERTFRNIKDAIQAHQEKKIGWRDRIKIMEDEKE